MFLRSATLGAVVITTAFVVQPTSGSAIPNVCSATPSPEYYQIALISTRRVPGTAAARGVGQVTFSASPFTVSLGQDGSYAYDVALDFSGLPEPVDGVYAVWFASTQLDHVQRLGAVGPERHLTGSVDWNQFIVVVSLEPSEAAIGDRWSGPIVMRGISRSGMLHTMAGHGPFQQENCAAYGY